MERVNRILKNDLYCRYVSENEKDEAERVFCHHDMVHFQDVARIAWILNLEEQAGIEKELIYAAALLHDIGRHLQYRVGTPHELASAELAPEILQMTGFDEVECESILSAIRTHRSWEDAKKHPLNSLLYRADKLSRPCYACKQEEKCNWKNDKKNLKLVY